MNGPAREDLPLALRFAAMPRRRLGATFGTLCRHPVEALAILRARLAGKRLRARQALAAIAGIDHRLALPGGRLPPAEPASMLAAHGIGRATASSDTEAASSIVLLLAPGHDLVAGASARIAQAFREDEALQALYGDALAVLGEGSPLPLLRPSFDPDYLRGIDYIGPVVALRRSSLDAIGGDLDPDHPALDALLRLDAGFGAGAVRHLPQVLSLWRVEGGGEAPASRLPCIRHDLDRRGQEAAVASVEPDGMIRVAYPLLDGRPRSHPSSHPLPRPEVPARSGGLEGSSRSLSDPWNPPSRPAARAPQDEGESRGTDRNGSSRNARQASYPLVSLIVPTRDRLDLLSPCLTSLIERTDWPAKEILVADNDSREPATLAYFRELEARGLARIVPHPGPFDFAAMNNAAAQAARGRLLAFVNNDVEAFRPDWLERLVREALRPKVGAVGPKLLDGHGRIQHGGVVLGTGGLVTHGHRHFPGDAPGYLGALRATHRVAAVTAACLVVQREKFEKVGGFDAARFAVDFNDVDLCLRLNEAGLRTLLVPSVVLHHREAASRRRTPEAAARHEAEVAAFRKRWGPLLAQDPHYHPGFDPGLSTHARLRPGWTGTEPAAPR